MSFFGPSSGYFYPRSFLNDPFMNDARISQWDEEDWNQLLLPPWRRVNNRNNNPNNNNNLPNTQKQLKNEEEKGVNSDSTMTMRNSDNNNNKANNENSFLSLWNDWDLSGHSSMDLKEEKDHYEVDAKLDGFDKPQLKLEIKNGALTVSGLFNEEKKDPDNKSYSKSSRYVSRSISLPSNILEDKISAKFENGRLKVHIPKAEKQKQEKSQIMIE